MNCTCSIFGAVAFPGIFRSALGVSARRINEPIKPVAAHDIASCIADREPSPEYNVPGVFNRDVAQRVAAAVSKAAIKTGVARKGRPAH